MQGPNLLILTNCHGCEFYERKNIFHRCNKLNVPLCTKLIVTKSENENGTGSSSEYEIPSCDVNCPFVKENELSFHDEKSRKLKEELSLKLKQELTSIFPEYWEYEDYLFKKTDVEISAAFKISQINFGQLINFQMYLPNYGLSIDACTRDKILVRVYKKMECF
jgi:hypothetical protein